MIQTNNIQIFFHRTARNLAAKNRQNMWAEHGISGISFQSRENSEQDIFGGIQFLFSFI